MRRLFIVLISACLFSPAWAQVKMGIKVSPQLTWTNTDSKSISAGSTRANIGYGLVVDYYFSENYALGSEFSIGTFGGTLRPDSVFVKEKGAGTKDLEYRYKMQYINVPLIIKMRTKEIGYFRYYAEFGLGMSYRFRAKGDISSSVVNLTNVDVNNPDPVDQVTLQNNGDLSQKVNFFRSSIIIGAGVQYNAFGNTLLVAGLRYDNALNNFTDEPRWKASMNFLALNLGVMF